MLALLLSITGCSSLTKQTREFGEGNIRLELPAQLLVRIIDGKKIKVPDFYEGTYTIRLTQGKHKIIFEYLDNWNPQGGRVHLGKIMRSRPLELNYNFNGSELYILNYKRPNNAQEAQSFALKPRIWLEKNGNNVQQANINNSVYLHDNYSNQ